MAYVDHRELRQVQEELAAVSAALLAKREQARAQVQALLRAPEDSYLSKLPVDLRRFEITRRLTYGLAEEIENLQRLELHLVRREEQLVGPYRILLLQRLAHLQMQATAMRGGSFHGMERISKELNEVKDQLRQIGYIIPAEQPRRTVLRPR
jgi:hypothetical protein